MTIALRFNDAINRADLAALVELMTDDHVFIDSAGNTVRGRDAAESAWRGFFGMFPDYRHVMDAVRVRGEDVFLFGRSTCSVAALNGPAMWTAMVREGRITQWRVEDDEESTRLRRLGLEDGTQPVTPYLYYARPREALNWLARVYDFAERPDETITDDAGAVVHAAMNAGRGVIMLGCPGTNYRNPRQLGTNTQNVYVYVEDVARHHEHSVSQGAQILEPPQDTFYGDRRYGTADLEGHHWYFAQKRAPKNPLRWAPSASDLERHGKPDGVVIAARAHQ